MASSSRLSKLRYSQPTRGSSHSKGPGDDGRLSWRQDPDVSFADITVEAKDLTVLWTRRALDRPVSQISISSSSSINGSATEALHEFLSSEAL